MRLHVMVGSWGWWGRRGEIKVPKHRTNLTSSCPGKHRNKLHYTMSYQLLMRSKQRQFWF